MSKYISDLIARGEHQKQDFKYEINDARKIAKTIVAFSNTEGGKLLIGVKDNGRIAGVRSEEEYYMVEAAASLYCTPEIEYKLTKWVINGKSVLEVDIQKGSDRPYKAKTHDNKWLAWIRVNDQNFMVNSIQLRVWKNEKRKKGVFLKFTESGRMLPAIMQTEGLTLNEYVRISGYNRKKASDILVNLISLGVVEILYNEKNITYKIVEKQLNNS